MVRKILGSKRSVRKKLTVTTSIPVPAVIWARKFVTNQQSTETTLGGMANITLPGFSTTAGITEVMTITVAYSTRKKSA